LSLCNYYEKKTLQHATKQEVDDKKGNNVNHMLRIEISNSNEIAKTKKKKKEKRGRTKIPKGDEPKREA